MNFQATYDDDGAPTDVRVDMFALEHTWGVAELHEGRGLHLKVTKTRVTVTASGYVAVYDIVATTPAEVVARLRSVRMAA